MAKKVMPAEADVWQWEYLIVGVRGHMNDRFNEFGRLGWELISVDTAPAINRMNESHTTAYFMRPVGRKSP